MKSIEKIICKECGERVHFIATHIEKAHKMSVGEYEAKYPKAPLMSEYGKEKVAEFKCKLHKETSLKVPFNIEKTFGIEAFSGAVKRTKGFEKPHSTTPKIDADYVFDKTALKIILFAIANKSEKVLFAGHTGTGKSSIIEQTVARLNLPYTRINCDGDMTRADFVGQHILEGEKTSFQYGLLPTAMREGHVLLIDEWDCANPSVGMALQAVLEDGGRLTITETGETVEPHPDFRIFATSNTIGQGDESGLYNGTQPQNYAALDRFSMVKVVDYAEPEVEKKIVSQKTGLKNESGNGATKYLDNIVKLAGLVRRAFIKEEIVATMSTRTLVNFANKIVSFGDPKFAFETCYLNKLNSDDRDVVSELYQRIWG